MKLIAHRGNLTGPNPDRENEPGYVLEALASHHDCEIDVWSVDGKWYLGHDTPQYKVPRSFLELPGLWVHAKDIATIRQLDLFGQKINYFWHEQDAMAFTSQGFRWTCAPEYWGAKTVLMVSDEPWTQAKLQNGYWYGLCNDWVSDAYLFEPSHMDYLQGESTQ
jgi:hypothetical protein